MPPRNVSFWKGRGLVLALLLLGAALRLGAVGQVPPGLYHDEAQHGLDALEVLAGHRPLYFEANNGREPLFVYLVAAGVAALGRTPLAVRLPAAFVGVLTLAATYDLARVLWGRRVGRWALAVLAATFWHVHLSRVGFRAVLLPLFTALWMAQAARAVRDGAPGHWIAAGALYGAGWYTYMAARFTPVAVGIVALYGLWRRRGRVGRGPLLFCAAALLVLLPLGVYTLRHPAVVLNRSGQVWVFSDEISGGRPWRLLLQHIGRTAGMFFLRGDRIWRHNLAGRPVWGPALGLAFVLGLGVALAHARRDAGAALAVLWTATMAVPTILAEDAPHFLRGVGMLPTVALLPALGLAWLEGATTRPLARRLPVALLALGFGHTAYDYAVRYADAPLTYHWFEGGPVALAGEVNTWMGQGWSGSGVLHSPRPGRTVYIDRGLWQSWTAVPFLVPEARVRFLPLAAPPALGEGVAFVVWPYDDWRARVLPYLPHPAYLRSDRGPQAQGDKDPAPITIAVIIRAAPSPDVPAPVARFEGGLLLRAALVQPAAGGARVRLWWEPTAPLAAPYTVFVHYLRDGELLAQHDGQPAQGHLPTTAWQPGDLVLDPHLLAGVTPDPARDRLRVGLYRSDTLEGLALLDAAGEPIGDAFTTGVILEP
jgi:4-amino-4-deoxy-L-arabinose transferase-like glycosyltransferase